MVEKDIFKGFNLEQLSQLKTQVLQAESKEEILEVIEELIEVKEKEEQEKATSLNSRFLVEWMNIDPPYIQMLHRNGIETLAQLRAIKDLWSIQGMTPNGETQISWAKEFFNMDSFEKDKEKTSTKSTKKSSGRQYAKVQKNTK